jgi:putative transposase
MFVEIVLYLCSTRLASWSMQPTTTTTQLVMASLLMAIFRRRPPCTVLHHRRDQGLQYTSEDLQRLRESHGIVCSMTRRGNCWANAAMKSFFSTLILWRVPASSDLSF